MAKGEPPKCFVCHQVITFSDQFIGKNGRKIPLDPETLTPHDCPMREKKLTFSGSTEDTARVVEVDKDDHGNELYEAQPDLTTGQRPLVSTKPIEYVDHTAKGLSKVKIFSSIGPDGAEIDYDKFLFNNQGKIKTQGAQFQMSRDEDNSVIFAIALYYEETA